MDPTSLENFQNSLYGTYFWFGLFAVGALLAIGHWFPWPRRLHRLEAYMFGVTALLIGEAIWLIPLGLLRLFLGLLLFAAIGGAVVIVAWGIDAIEGHIVKDKANSGRRDE